MPKPHHWKPELQRVVEKAASNFSHNKTNTSIRAIQKNKIHIMAVKLAQDAMKNFIENERQKKQDPDPKILTDRVALTIPEHVPHSDLSAPDLAEARGKACCILQQAFQQVQTTLNSRNAILS